MEIQLSMLILEVRDLTTSIAFYRDLGLDLPDPCPVDLSSFTGWAAASACC